NIPVPDAVAALKSKQIAAFAEPDTVAPLVLDKGLVAIDHAQSHPDLTGTSVTIGATGFLTKHPKFVGEWNAAIQDALAAGKENPDAFYAYQAAANEVTPAQAKVFADLDKAWPTSAAPKDALDRLTATSKFLLERKLTAAPVDVSAWLAPGLTPTA